LQTNNSEPANKPGAPARIVKASMPMMPSVAPLFLEGSGFSSTLHLVNETKFPLKAHIDIFSVYGDRAAGTKLTIPAFGLHVVQVRDLLDASAAGLDIGSIRVSADQNSDGLLAVLTFTHTGRGANNYFDEELLMPTMDGSNILRGVTDNAASSIVAITSLADTMQHVRVTCASEDGERIHREFQLLPNQTRLEHVCSKVDDGPRIRTIEQMMIPSHSPWQTRFSRSAGISISSDGMPGEIAAYGIVPHVSEHGERTAYFTTLNFTDPKLKKSGGAVYTGIPVGSSPLLPQDVYTPKLSLANFGSKPVSVSIEGAITKSEKPETRPLASFFLVAGQAKTIRLDRMPRSPDLRSSILIKTNAAPGDLITKLISEGNSRQRAVEMLDRDIGNGPNGGGHPWNITPGLTSTLVLFNHDSKAQPFNIRFGGKDPANPWMKKYTLAPMETLAISINDLIAAQTEDDNGNKLSLTQLSGEVGWQADNGNVAGRMVQTDPAVGMAQNFSCSNYYTNCNPTIYPSQLELWFSQTGPLSGNEGWNLSHFGPNSSCSCGAYTSGSGSLYYTWASGNSSIASILSGGAAVNSQWYGQSGGQTTASFSVTGPYGISCQVQAPVVVQRPTASRIVATTQSNALSSGQSPCGAGQAGWIRVVTKAVTDQIGSDIAVSGQYLQEAVTIGLPNDLNISGTQTGTATTNSSGQFQDTLFVCSAVCPQSGGHTLATQAISDTYLGTPYTLTGNTFNYTCSGITINGQ
jgi:hypothetical protein